MDKERKPVKEDVSMNEEYKRCIGAFMKDMNTEQLKIAHQIMFAIWFDGKYAMAGEET